MNEFILREYFEDHIEPEELNDNLIGSYIKSSDQINSYEINDMLFEFEIKPECIIKLCKDVIEGKIQPEHLQIISFSLISSQRFFWDCNENKRLDEMDAILHEWCSPEINYVLSIENIKKCLYRLS